MDLKVKGGIKFQSGVKGEKNVKGNFESAKGEKNATPWVPLGCAGVPGVR